MVIFYCYVSSPEGIALMGMNPWVPIDYTKPSEDQETWWPRKKSKVRAVPFGTALTGRYL